MMADRWWGTSRPAFCPWSFRESDEAAPPDAPPDHGGFPVPQGSALSPIQFHREWPLDPSDCHARRSLQIKGSTYQATRRLRPPVLAADLRRCSSFIISLGLIFLLKPSILRSAAFSSLRFWPSSFATLACFISRAMSINDSYSQIS